MSLKQGLNIVGSEVFKISTLIALLACLCACGEKSKTSPSQRDRNKSNQEAKESQQPTNESRGDDVAGNGQVKVSEDNGANVRAIINNKSDFYRPINGGRALMVFGIVDVGGSATSSTTSAASGGNRDVSRYIFECMFPDATSWVICPQGDRHQFVNLRDDIYSFRLRARDSVSGRYIEGDHIEFQVGKGRSYREMESASDDVNSSPTEGSTDTAINQPSSRSIVLANAVKFSIPQDMRLINQSAENDLDIRSYNQTLSNSVVSGVAVQERILISEFNSQRPFIYSQSRFKTLCSTPATGSQLWAFYGASIFQELAQPPMYSNIFSCQVKLPNSANGNELGTWNVGVIYVANKSMTQSLPTKSCLTKDAQSAGCTAYRHKALVEILYLQPAGSSQTPTRFATQMAERLRDSFGPIPGPSDLGSGNSHMGVNGGGNLSNYQPNYSGYQ